MCVGAHTQVLVHLSCSCRGSPEVASANGSGVVGVTQSLQAHQHVTQLNQELQAVHRVPKLIGRLWSDGRGLVVGLQPASETP